MDVGIWSYKNSYEEVSPNVLLLNPAQQIKGKINNNAAGIFHRTSLLPITSSYLWGLIK